MTAAGTASACNGIAARPELLQLSRSASALAAGVDPGLVDVTATLGYRQAISAGTAMVPSPWGRVITNNHVIESANSVTVTDVAVSGPGGPDAG